MLSVHHTPSEFFQAPAPRPLSRARRWLEAWNFFVRDAPYRRGVASALADNRPDRLRLWLKLGARPDMRLVMGATPLDTLLMVAVACRRLECARVLLEAGASVSLASPGQSTPLCLAASESSPIRPMCELLVSHGARWREFRPDAQDPALAVSALGLALRRQEDLAWALGSACLQDAQQRADGLDALLAPAASALPQPRPRF